MNKTVNINLAGIFFHIDEDAYLKLQRYLEAIKRSFTDSQGRSEIIADIEARIAELFAERIKNDRQVIGVKEVDEIIAIMGQPEDYLVDDEIFEDEPQHKTYTQNKSRKLYRDTENSYVSGVSSGLGHYFGIDALWVRILWLVLVFGGFGTGILVYILLWILIPEARTTSEKIQMTGEKVTISNIEKKIRDGFDTVSESVGENFQKTSDKLKEGFESASDSFSNSVKNIDVNKQTNKIKSSSQTFFDAIADVFMFILKIFAKFIGVILMFTGAVGVIALTVALIGSSFADTMHIGNSTVKVFADDANSPSWLVALLAYFIAAIPLLLIFYLGLKILVNNLRSIGNVAKFTLLGVWILSLIGIAIIATKKGLSYSEKAQIVNTEQLFNIKQNDTLTLSMNANDYYAENFKRHLDSYETGFIENGDKVTYSQGVRLIVKSTKDSVAKIRVLKSARGFNNDSAKTRAENIDYKYILEGNTLKLDNHFLIPNDNKHRDQRVEITLYLPEGSYLLADKNTYNYHSNNSSYYNDILDQGMEDYYLQVKNNKLICEDCPKEEDEDADDFTIDVNINNENAKLKINADGIEAASDNNSIEINDDGVKSKTNNVEVNIDEDGIKITSDKNKE